MIRLTASVARAGWLLNLQVGEGLGAVLMAVDTRLMDIQEIFENIDEWYPYPPKYLSIFMYNSHRGKALNAVNLTDGMDTLATVPLMTVHSSQGAVAYIGGDLDFATKLKIPHLSHDIKELAVLAAAIISAGFALLKYNAPPAQTAW